MGASREEETEPGMDPRLAHVMEEGEEEEGLVKRTMKSVSGTGWPD